MISILSNILTGLLSVGVIAFLVKIYVDIKRGKKELEALKNAAIQEDIKNEKKSIHQNFDNQSISKLLDSSPDIYSKLRSPKDN